jgi:N-acetylglucosamine-6-sulfatase
MPARSRIQKAVATQRALALLLVLAALQWGLIDVGTSPRPAHAQTAGPPNVVLIVTDDQRLDTLHVMPQVRRHLVAGGMTLRRAIVTNPLCCPSRATILTGRYSHTTGVYTNSAGSPNGGWPAFQPSESDTIATALHDVGYRTALIGKYINGYTGEDVYVPSGWDRWFAFSGAGSYFRYPIFDDVRGHVRYGSSPEDYSTDVIRRQAVSFIRTAPEGAPLFLVVTPFAPHAPFTAAPRDDGDFASAPVALGPAVNEADVSDKPAYIVNRPVGLASSVRARTRDQWESLRAVDTLVARIMNALGETGRKANTLVIFTSDNGLSNREHRWLGKHVPYEESIRVPLIIRLPGRIPAGSVSRRLVSNVDLAPTIADFAGASLSADGVSMRPLLTAQSSSVRGSVLLEHVRAAPAVPTYCGARTGSFMFVRYATGEEELYDLAQDPYQLRNVASSRRTKARELRNLTKSLCQPVPPGFSW